jgi:hypothetical protein
MWIRWGKDAADANKALAKKGDARKIGIAEKK